MNPAKAFLHLFSPLAGEDADNYRSPGQISFLRAPFVPIDADELKKTGVKYAFIGAPFDEGSVGKPGCEDGAREFRVASLDYFPYWFEFNVDLHGTAIDCGDVQMPRVNPKVAHERIYGAVRTVLGAGITPIVCGGDRSVSIPAAKALSDHLGANKKMGYMHFGAHLDFADSWAGERQVSTCAMARITELDSLAAENVATSAPAIPSIRRIMWHWRKVGACASIPCSKFWNAASTRSWTRSYPRSGTARTGSI